MRAGQPDKAVEQFVRTADNLNGEGFLPRAAALYKKILKIRPNHEHAMLRVGEIAASQGVLVDARAFLSAVAEKRRASGDEAGAAAVRRRLFDAYVAAGDLDRAREFAVTTELRSVLGQAMIARGNLAGAGELLAADGVNADAELLLMFAQHALASGAVEDGLMATHRLLAGNSARGTDVSDLACRFADSMPQVGLRLIEIVAERAIVEGDWQEAAAVLDRYIAAAPDHIPALQRLVEIAVDGGLESTLTFAQSRLVDAYLDGGAASDARPIIEDLLIREPDFPVHIERLRRALTLLGEPDPERLIAEQMGVSLEEPQPVEVAPDAPIDASDRATEAAAARTEEAQDPLVVQGEAEIDLSDLLADLSVAQVPEAPQPKDLEEVFGRLREEAARADAGDARAAYERGVALKESGSVEESIAAFESACRDTRWRFQAASAIAQLYKQRQQPQQAIEWLERAVEAQPPDPAQGHEVFYELADTLESMGETERALAVCLELQAEAGNYRDVAERIRRLTAVRA
jgi:tetratricopeptide (TPR) repeat protein